MSRSTVTLGLILVLAAFGGCGLKEYNAKFASEQKRIEAFDRQNRLLDKRIELRKDNATAKPPLDVSFRPPRGIAIDKLEIHIPGMFYHYPRVAPSGSYAMSIGASSMSPQPAPGTGAATIQPVVATTPSESGFFEIYLALAQKTKREKLVSDCAAKAPFFDAVDQSKIQKAIPTDPIVIPADGKGAVLSPADTTPAASRYYIHFLQGPEETQAIYVFRVATAKDKTPDVTDAMSLSLKSLTLGHEPAP